MSVGLAVQQLQHPCQHHSPLLQTQCQPLLHWHYLPMLLIVSLVLWQCCHLLLALQVTQIVLQNGREQLRLSGASAGA